MKKIFVFFLLANAVFTGTIFAQNTGDFITRVDFQNGVQTLIITGYTGNSKDVVIPAVINNIPVKTIGEKAFALKGLTSVVIPEGIECISQMAFYGNKLGRVDIPNSVRIIADSAFDSNLLLKVVDGASVTVNAPSKTKNSSGIYYVASGKDEPNTVPKNSTVQNSVTSSQYNTSGYDVGAAQVRMQQNFYSPVSVNLNAPANQQAVAQPELCDPSLLQNAAKSAAAAVEQYEQYDIYAGYDTYTPPQYDPPSNAQNNQTKSSFGYTGSSSSYTSSSSGYTSTSSGYTDTSSYTGSSLESAEKAKYKKAADQYDEVCFEGEYEDSVVAYNEVESAPKVVAYKEAASAPKVASNPELNVASQPKLFTIARSEDGQTSVAGYKGNQKAVALPNSIGTTKVSAVAKMAFAGKQLTFVNIPEGYKYIGNSAFMSNNLVEIIIPNSIQYIGSQAFVGNYLQAITIGADVVMETDSFSYRFADYYKMAGSRAGTYIYKAGQWDLNGVEQVDYNVRRNW